MHKSATFLFSLLIGSVVVIGLAWMMSKMIQVGPTPLEKEEAGTTITFLSERERQQQCDKDNAEIGLLVRSSQSCQSDEECIRIPVSQQFANYLGCSVVVRLDARKQIVRAFSQQNQCQTGLICNGPRVSSYTAVCRNNLCTSERQEMPPSLDVLTEKTLKSISNSLLEESGEVDD